MDRKIKRYFLYAIFLLLATYLIYSITVYLRSGVKEEGLTLCEAGRCFWIPGDIHADVEIKVCGKSINLPLDKGSTEGPHTHKERNKIHFEGKLEIDQQTKEIINKTPLKLKTFFEVIETRFNSGCIVDKCTGDYCNDKIGVMGMWVNGVENKEFEEYVWKDKDTILIKFGGV